MPALTSDLLVGAAEQTKKCVFCFFLIVRVLVFLFFIDRYSSVYHLPMINLTKLTAVRRHVYPKMTTFQKRSQLFHGRQPEHCVCSAAPTSKADVSAGTQMDLTAMEYSHFIRRIKIYHLTSLWEEEGLQETTRTLPYSVYQ